MSTIVGNVYITCLPTSVHKVRYKRRRHVKLFCLIRTSYQKLCSIEMRFMCNSIHTKTKQDVLYMIMRVSYVVVELLLGGLDTELVLPALVLLRVVRIVSLASLSSRLNHGSSNSLGSLYGTVQPNAIKGTVSLISISLIS